MEDMIVFKNDNFGEIRTIIIDNEPWFVGKDVANILGYQNGSRDINRHVDEEDRKTITSENYQNGTFEIPNRGFTIISESGMYALIFGSKLDSAKHFKHWVTSEVLPSIRKNGGYIAGQENLSDEELLAKAILVAQKKIAERDEIIAKQKETIEKQDSKLQIQKPFVDFAIIVQNAKGTITMDKMATLLSKQGVNIGRNNLYKFLRNQKVLKENNIPYRKYIKAGCFKMTETVKENHYGQMVFTTTLITGKGQILIAKKVDEALRREEIKVD